MRIRRNASRLLGSTVSAPPRFELPPPSGFGVERPPPAHESHAGFGCKASSWPPPETCVESFSPWDLMDLLDLLDPQEEERFVETYSVPVGCRAGLLHAPLMPAGSVKHKEEKQEGMVVDKVNGVILEMHLAEKKNNAARKTSRKKSESKRKGERHLWRVEPEDEEDEEHEEYGTGQGGGGAQMWTCKKNSGRGWFCRRPVSQPNSLCLYHSHQKPAPSISKEPRRKRAAVDVDQGFYYYTGFGPCHGKRHRVRGSSSSVPESPLPADEKGELWLPEEHIDVTTGQAQDGTADHQVAAPARVDDKPRWDDDGMAGIAGFDELISSDDDDALGCNGEWAGDVKKRKSPLKKRWRKPVKARSINSLM